MTSRGVLRAAAALVLTTLVVSASPAVAQVDCSRAAASVTELWPPNHKLVPISITGVVGATSITVTGVTQDEPLNGTGDGDTCPDAEITPRGVNLRAERAGGGNGRVYVVSFTAIGPVGGFGCSGAVRVCVPHDRGRGSSCVDDGQTVDSLGPCN